MRSRPISFTYLARLDRADSVLAGSIQYAHNLSGGSDNNDAAYSGNRAGATRDWQALRYSLDGWRIAPWVLVGARARAVCERAAHPGRAVRPRRRDERARIARARSDRRDRHHVYRRRSLPLPWEGWNAIVFVDAGEVRVKDAAPGQQARQGASSVGVGLRWTIARRFLLAIDAAQVLDGTAASETGDRRIHASVIYRF